MAARYALILCLLAMPSFAVIETYEFSDPSLETRYHALSQELRCPKCQNQNIADSNAPISRDLRALLHKQLEAGADDGEILDFMVDRYGEFVRYRPAVDEKTAILWYAPFVLVGIGGLLLILHLRRRGAASVQAEPSEEDIAQLRARLAAIEAGEDAQ